VPTESTETTGRSKDLDGSTQSEVSRHMESDRRTQGDQVINEVRVSMGGDPTLLATTTVANEH